VLASVKKVTFTNIEEVCVKEVEENKLYDNSKYCGLLKAV
jgi:hypothetical protein